MQSGSTQSSSSQLQSTLYGLVNTLSPNVTCGYQYPNSRPVSHNLPYPSANYTSAQYPSNRYHDNLDFPHCDTLYLQNKELFQAYEDTNGFSSCQFAQINRSQNISQCQYSPSSQSYTDQRYTKSTHALKEVRTSCAYQSRTHNAMRYSPYHRSTNSPCNGLDQNPLYSALLNSY
ncbi:hypothetical protein FSP39_013384 [Pinctada imbricata]|uniref:Uncharacterized protein n=1 Tax=Pinctada imbricata TaxID=66713 RepID=A0AA89C3D8_PINIB|nr:hypothetical protein FSP39_013384 [Pinctada imbricata]